MNYDSERDNIERLIEYSEVTTFFESYSKGQTVPEKGVELLTKIKEFYEREEK